MERCKRSLLLLVGLAPTDMSRTILGLRPYGFSPHVHARSEDAHGSEYVASADERRSFLTGFSGSAGRQLFSACACLNAGDDYRCTGSAIVTEKQALLWTDSRYFLQAEKQLAGSLAAAAGALAESRVIATSEVQSGC